MSQPIAPAATFPAVRISLRHSPSRFGFYLLYLALTLASLSLAPAPNAFGVTPAPDGGYADENTAEGSDALFSLTTGTHNTAIGFRALFDNTSGGLNTATGAFALRVNIDGTNNTADGYSALRSNTTGELNTATGSSALTANTTGSFNTANGFVALASNTTGDFNTACGIAALANSSTGTFNMATGARALIFNTTGSDNTASGSYALYSNTTGNNNIALGSQAGISLTTGSNNIAIGAPGKAGESNAIRIGKAGTQTKTFIQGIVGSPISSGLPVVVSSAGRLGVSGPSSARFKDAIKPMDQASAGLLALEPVTFRYKEELDPEGMPQFGLVAEEVEKVNPDLVLRDAEGKVFGVRYEAVNAMLLNEFLKEHRRSEDQARKVQELEATVAQQRQEQQKAIEALAAKVDAQAAGTQKKVAARNPRSRSGRR